MFFAVSSGVNLELNLILVSKATEVSLTNLQ